MFAVWDNTRNRRFGKVLSQGTELHRIVLLFRGRHLESMEEII